MTTAVSLPVYYHGKELEFPFRLIRPGARHRFSVEVFDTEVIFEMDPGGYYRVALPENAPPPPIPDRELLDTIRTVLGALSVVN